MPSVTKLFKDLYLFVCLFQRNPYQQFVNLIHVMSIFNVRCELKIMKHKNKDVKDNGQ